MRLETRTPPGSSPLEITYRSENVDFTKLAASIVETKIDAAVTSENDNSRRHSVSSIVNSGGSGSESLDPSLEGLLLEVSGPREFIRSNQVRESLSGEPGWKDHGLSTKGPLMEDPGLKIRH